MNSTCLALLGCTLLACACSNSAPPKPARAPADTSPPSTVTMSPALLQRTDAPAPPPPAPPPPPASGASDDVQQANAVRASIVAEVANHFPKLRACYDRGTDKHPGLAGRVSIRFTVAPAGEVVTADDDGSTLADPDTVTCVKNEFAGMKFAQWNGKAVTVVYPIEFSMAK